MPRKRTKSQKRSVKKQAGILSYNRKVFTDLKILEDEYKQEFEEVLRELVKFNKKDDSTKVVSSDSNSDSRDLIVQPSEKNEQPQENNMELSPSSATFNDFEPWAKKLYRKIMLKVHPDRIDLASSFNAAAKFELLSYGTRIRPAIEKKDYPQILEIGVCLDCEVEDLTTQEQSEILISESRSIQKKMNEIQNSLAWHWCENYDNEQVLIQLLTQACKLLGIPPMAKISLIEFINFLESEDNVTGFKKCRRKKKRPIGQRPQKR